MTAVQVKSVPLPPVDFREVLRYAACRGSDREVLQLARWAAAEAGPCLHGRVCWRETDITIRNDTVYMDGAAFPSKKLTERLTGCQRAVVFAATVGLELDRLMARYGRLAPARGLMLQSLGTERIEALCNRFEAEMAECYAAEGIRPRYSPGYGDLPLESQKEIFAMLECPKRIGLYLSGSFQMTPSKSVTAIIGIGGKDGIQTHCGACSQKDCAYRRVTT